MVSPVVTSVTPNVPRLVNMSNDVRQAAAPSSTLPATAIQCAMKGISQTVGSPRSRARARTAYTTTLSSRVRSRSCREMGADDNVRVHQSSRNLLDIDEHSDAPEID